jgi:hypothetical protein
LNSLQVCRSPVDYWASKGGKFEGSFFTYIMKTIQQLEIENQELLELLRKTRDQLTLALNEVARNHTAKMKAKGEFHHRQFEKLCPAPDLSQITIIK